MNKLISFLAILLLTISVGSATAFAQAVNGKVTDSSGAPLPGVAVFFKGSSVGVETNASGAYSIKSKDGYKTLVFALIGMKEKEVNIDGRKEINVVMEDESTFLDEAVAIGYSTVQRRDLLGSVTSASNKDIVGVPVTNFSEALTGKLAGVSVRTAEGEPDATVEIKVRGTGSITQDSSPLYIVDGFPVNSISDLSPSEIKSIDVLKDAFSTAIYGSQGAYGVVLITTKDGGKGKFNISYDGYMGAKIMANANALEMMSPYDYARYNYEAAVLQDPSLMTGKASSIYEPHFGTFADMDLYKTTSGNNWRNIMFGSTGTTMSHSVNLNGSSDRTRWTASYANLSENAIMLGSDFKRHNLAVKMNTSPLKNLNFNFSARWSKTIVNGSGANSIADKGNTAGNGRLINALRYSPIPIDYLDDTEDYDIYSTSFGANPARDVKDNDSHKERDNYNLTASILWTIIPNLKFKIDGGMDNTLAVDDRFYGLSSYYIRSKATIIGKPCMETTTTSAQTYRGSATLSYDFKNIMPSKRHKLDILAGSEVVFRGGYKETTLAEGFPKNFTSSDARKYRATADAIIASNKYFQENDLLISVFGRANYTYDKRYSMSFAMRADASSKFSKNNYWGYFPSGAVAWDVANEPFLKYVAPINQLKLRYSFGTAGNNRIPVGQTRAQFITTQTAMIYGINSFIAPSSIMPNNDLRWETTYSHNLGLDFALLKTRISGSIEAYHNTTKDLLINFPTPGTGYTSQYRNIGSVLNQGVELSLKLIAVEMKNFGLQISGNIALNNNKVLKLGVNEIKSESRWQSTGVGWDYLVKEGDPLGTVYGYQYDGMYQIEDFDYSYYESGAIKWSLREEVPAAATSNIHSIRPGAPKFKDINSDGKIDENDKVAIGNTLPKGTGGFNIAMNAYGFDLNAAFNFSFGNQIYNANAAELSVKGLYNYKNLLSKYTPGDGKAWTNIDWKTGKQIDDPVTLAQVNKDATTWTAATANYFMADCFMEDGSFLRLGSLTVGYTIPAKLTERIKIKKLRIYFTGSNLFCLTKYSGYDPEVDTRRSTCLTPGVDYSAYPKSRGFVGGLNITF